MNRFLGEGDSGAGAKLEENMDQRISTETGIK